MNDYRINLICCADVIENEVAQDVSQRGISLTYAMAIKSEAAKADNVDWRKANTAIINKWGMKSLDRIKKRAFDILAGKVVP